MRLPSVFTGYQATDADQPGHRTYATRQTPIFRFYPIMPCCPGGRLACVLLRPPWPAANRSRGKRPAASPSPSPLSPCPRACSLLLSSGRPYVVGTLPEGRKEAHFVL